MRRVDRLENDSVPAKYLSVEAFESLSTEELDRSPKRDVRKLQNVVKNSLFGNPAESL
jgi:hypothetical protein